MTRSSRQATIIVACLLCLAPLHPLCQPLPIAPRPDYPILHDSLTGRGVPLGGVGCGTVTIRPDGSIGDITTNNNWSHPIRQAPGCFAAIWTSAGTETTALSLRLSDPYKLPCVSHIDYAALYPQARLAYGDQALPVQVSCRAMSPALPYDDRASALPVAMFIFTVTNQARGPLDAAIAVSWEDLLGVGGSGATGPFANRTGCSIEEEPVVDRRLGLHFLPPPLPGTSPPNRLPYNARGDYALLVERGADERDTSWASWNSLAASPPWWASFAREGRVEGEVGESKESVVHPAGVLAIRFRLKPGETREVPFALAWYTPRFYALDGREYGHYYERSFSDAVSVARYCLDNRRTLVALTDEWQSFLMRSSIPGWLAHALMGSLSHVSSHTILTRDGGEPAAGASSLAILRDPVTEPGATSRGLRFLEDMVAISALAPQFAGAGLQGLAEQFPQSPSLDRFERNMEAGLAPQPQPGRRVDFEDAVALGCLIQMTAASGDALKRADTRLAALQRAAAAYRAGDPAIDEICRVVAGGPPSSKPLAPGSASPDCYTALAALAGVPVADALILATTNPTWAAVNLIRSGKVAKALPVLKRMDDTDQAADCPGLLLALHGLAGVSYDPTTQRITIGPKPIDGVPVSAYPVVGASWWAWVERRQTIGSVEIRFRLLRVLPRATGTPQPAGQDLPGLAIGEVMVPELRPGQWAEIALNRDALDPAQDPAKDPRVQKLRKPITLTSGQTLVVVIRTDRPTGARPSR